MPRAARRPAPLLLPRRCIGSATRFEPHGRWRAASVRRSQRRMNAQTRLNRGVSSDNASSTNSQIAATTGFGRRLSFLILRGTAADRVVSIVRIKRLLVAFTTDCRTGADSPIPLLPLRLPFAPFVCFTVQILALGAVSPSANPRQARADVQPERPLFLSAASAQSAVEQGLLTADDADGRG